MMFIVELWFWSAHFQIPIFVIFYLMSYLIHPMTIQIFILFMLFFILCTFFSENYYTLAFLPCLVTYQIKWGLIKVGCCRVLELVPFWVSSTVMPSKSLLMIYIYKYNHAQTMSGFRLWSFTPNPFLGGQLPAIVSSADWKRSFFLLSISLSTSS